METFEAIGKRVSTREYADKPVERALLEKLVDAGMRAPSARAVEPWRFVVVTEKDALEKLGQIADHGPFIAEAAACIAVYCEDTKYYLEDGCAATENILLAAADIGIGTCWVAGDKKAYASEVDNLLKAPQNFMLISLIALGWRKSEKQQRKNRDLDEVLFWESF